MEILTNISTFECILDRFNHSHKVMNDFLEQYQLDGFEMIQYKPWEETMIPKEMIKGIHLRYYPTWIEFWRKGDNALMHPFQTKEDMVNAYKKEIENVSKTHAKYMVFHVSHVEIEHCFNRKFTYTDMDVVECSIELLNKVLKGYKGNLTLLLENLWWPGLTLKDRNIIEKLMSEIEYENKGFMLDIGHLMNTNVDLKSEEEAVEYIEKIIDDLGTLKQYVKGIHLNSSLSGEYVKHTLNQYQQGILPIDPTDYEKLFHHISKIDEHKPFLNKNIKKIINKIHPDYLVYEWIPESMDQLKEYIKQQNKVLFS